MRINVAKKSTLNSLPCNHRTYEQGSPVITVFSLPSLHVTTFHCGHVLKVWTLHDFHLGEITGVVQERNGGTKSSTVPTIFPERNPVLL